MAYCGYIQFVLVLSKAFLFLTFVTRGTEHHSLSIIELFSQTRCFAGTLARERDGYSICRDWHTGDRGNGEER